MQGCSREGLRVPHVPSTSVRGAQGGGHSCQGLRAGAAVSQAVGVRASPVRSPPERGSPQDWGPGLRGPAGACGGLWGPVGSGLDHRWECARLTSSLKPADPSLPLLPGG